jgi:rhodanese-related sulfurtransferase
MVRWSWLWLVAFVFLGTALGADPAKDKSPVKTVDPWQAQALVNAKKDLVILDVRTPAERADGYLAGSTNVDFRAPNFREQLAQLDRSKTYLVYCVRGQRRTTETAAALDQLGFTNVLCLDGGYNAWVKDGKPIQK